MPRLSLIPRRPDAGPRETLLWVRRVEVAGGLAAFAVAAAVWSDAWWDWLLIAAGIIGLSPWPGARVILRRADRHPDVLVTDPQRRAERGRRVARAMIVMVPLYAVVGFIVGLIASCLGVAIAMAVLMGFSALAGVLLFRRREQP
jgi:hypothetical protein